MINEELIHALSELDKERQKYVIDVTILDRDNRPVSTGKAILDTPETNGVFEPSAGTIEGFQPNVATALKTSDGSLYYLEDFRQCSTNILHYHFRTRK